MSYNHPRPHKYPNSNPLSLQSACVGIPSGPPSMTLEPALLKALRVSRFWLPMQQPMRDAKMARIRAENCTQGRVRLGVGQ